MSSSMAVDAPPKLNLDEFIGTALSGTPEELHPFFESFRVMHTRKLWHQLTVKLFEFVDHPSSKPFRVDVFEKFVSDFEPKMNQLRLVELGVRVSKDIDNPQTHLTFLTSLLSRINPSAISAATSSQATDKEKEKDKPTPASTSVPKDEQTSHQLLEATVLLLSSIAHAKLLYGDLDGTKADMDAAWAILDTMEGVETSVNAAYYGVAADYYKGKAEYAPYYRNSLLYLACVDLAVDMTQEERLGRAHDLGISALMGDTIYNFGELLMHPILDALDSTPFEWIKKLLFTFNEGSIGKFEALAPLLPQEPILQEAYPFLRQKICLMALIESVFKRIAATESDSKTGSHGRTMSFDLIAQETRLPVDEVEHLVMKALSLKLIRGSLDQPAAIATITWVQPRVLSRKQIGDLAGRLEGWVNKLGAVERRVASEGAQSAGGLGGVAEQTAEVEVGA